ncbi:hypothetical protein CFOL_v3_23453 [Cephalotus follicularis]|uniref:Uncharacterized protein n=1 Tax=Cephalotus follicularis TaxID=3775 RepID=A0A1Q3CIV1_CEPFO|nr:hypothetical protein CFOL_v3_23453 [Cephalotus follicularis]
MAKFNVVQKKRRALVGEKKRALHGDPFTGKLKNRSQPLSVSGKRKRKLFKRWRREQKEAMEKGLVTMQDIEMAVTEGTSQDTDERPKKFHVKKGLKIKQLKRKGESLPHDAASLLPLTVASLSCCKNRRNTKRATEASVDSMVE